MSENKKLWYNVARTIIKAGKINMVKVRNDDFSKIVKFGNKPLPELFI